MDRRAAPPSHLERLACDGFTVVRGALDADELEQLRVAFAEASAGSTTHVEITDDTPFAATWRSLPRHRAVATLVEQLLPSFDARVHGREPGPGAGGQGLHADLPAGDGDDGQVAGLTMLWMFDAFESGNGATAPRTSSSNGTTGSAATTTTCSRTTTTSSGHSPRSSTGRPRRTANWTPPKGSRTRSSTAAPASTSCTATWPAAAT